ncbi:FAST kinase domain-containing protein 5, mitochondrial [Amia ocellicauda]|uniref:FAST kinase domain-containing protein 5, mitochondrial n=1 Tax=Amia ocellicauda TaxID=2972642 RepID=UPI0034638A25
MLWGMLYWRLTALGRLRLAVASQKKWNVEVSSGQLRSSHSDREQQQQQQQQQQEHGQEPSYQIPQTTCLLEYRVPYSPSAYPIARPGRTPPTAPAELEEDLAIPTSPPPGARQLCNPYSVSSSRRLSSVKNTLLDLTFSRPAVAHRPHKEGDGYTPREDHDFNSKEDPRAFQRERSEYSVLCHDLSEPQFPPLSAEEASLLLHRVTVLRGGLQPDAIVDFLSALGRLPPPLRPPVRGDSRFAMLCRYAVESLPRMCPTQLLALLRAFVCLELPPGHSMLALYEAELCRRGGMLNRTQLLLAGDLWRCLGRSAPLYLDVTLTQLEQSWQELSVAELVQLLYLVGEGRRAPAALLPRLELLLLQYLEELTAEELGAVSLGLFKSQSVLSQCTVRRLADIGLAQLPGMSNLALVNLLKLLRFSRLEHRGLLRALGQEVPRRAGALGPPALMHVALTCSTLRYRDERVLEAVAAAVLPLASRCRNKDAAKLLWAFCSLGYDPRNRTAFLGSLIQQLRVRTEELERYPQHLLTALLALAFAGEFPSDLVGLALSPRFVSLASNFHQLELKKDLFMLDGSVGLELPDWVGPRLPSQLCHEVTKVLWGIAQEDMCQRPEVLEAEALLQELLGGPSFVRKHMILPHTRSIDLEVCLESSGRALPLNECSTLTALAPPNPRARTASSRGWEEQHTAVPLTEDLLAKLLNNLTLLPPSQPAELQPQHSTPCRASEENSRQICSGVILTEGLLDALTGRPSTALPLPPRPTGPRRLAVQVCSRNQYCSDTRFLMGLHAMKRRQLGQLGYCAVELHPWEWLPLLRRSRADKLAYLHSKLYSTLD